MVRFHYDHMTDLGAFLPPIQKFVTPRIIMASVVDCGVLPETTQNIVIRAMQRLAAEFVAVDIIIKIQVRSSDHVNMEFLVNCVKNGTILITTTWSYTGTEATTQAGSQQCSGISQSDYDDAKVDFVLWFF